MRANIIEIGYEEDAESIIEKLTNARIIVCLDNEANTACYVASRGVNQKTLWRFAKKTEGK